MCKPNVSNGLPILLKRPVIRGVAGDSRSASRGAPRKWAWPLAPPSTPPTALGAGSTAAPLPPPPPTRQLASSLPLSPRKKRKRAAGAGEALCGPQKGMTTHRFALGCSIVAASHLCCEIVGGTGRYPPWLERDSARKRGSPPSLRLQHCCSRQRLCYPPHVT